MVDLSPEPEELIKERLRFGRYSSIREDIIEALRLLDQRDRLFRPGLADDADAIEEGWQAARRGDVADGDEVFERIDFELAELDRVGIR